MFRFDALRAGIVEEVTARVVDAHAHGGDGREPLDQLLNDVVIHERRRLRRIAPPDTEADLRRVEDIAHALQRQATEGELLEMLRRLARAYVEDIAGSFSVPTYRIATSVLPAALSLLAREQLSGEPAPAAARRVLDLWRDSLGDKADAALAEMAHAQDRQEGYERAARKLLAALDLAEAEVEAESEEQEEGEEGGESSPQQD